MSNRKAKKVTLKFTSDAEKYRLMQAEELLKKCGYVYDSKKKGWIKKKGK